MKSKGKFPLITLPVPLIQRIGVFLLPADLNAMRRSSGKLCRAFDAPEFRYKWYLKQFEFEALEAAVEYDEPYQKTFSLLAEHHCLRFMPGRSDNAWNLMLIKCCLNESPELEGIKSVVRGVMNAAVIVCEMFDHFCVPAKLDFVASEFHEYYDAYVEGFQMIPVIIIEFCSWIIFEIAFGRRYSVRNVAVTRQQLEHILSRLVPPIKARVLRQVALCHMKTDQDCLMGPSRLNERRKLEVSQFVLPEILKGLTVTERSYVLEFFVRKGVSANVSFILANFHVKMHFQRTGDALWNALMSNRCVGNKREIRMLDALGAGGSCSHFLRVTKNSWTERLTKQTKNSYDKWQWLFEEIEHKIGWNNICPARCKQKK
jgi:hypothetical protein